VRVPESRARPRESARTIRVAVAIFSRAGGAGRPALFFLSGGPGDAAIETAVRLFTPAFASFLDQRDLVVVDQRGTGRSEPSLDCPTRDLAGCRATLAEHGIDLASYTTANNAADINDVRRALGYEQIDLLGGSYGTLLAQAIMRDFPGAVRSAVLDSAAPLQQLIQYQLVRDFEPALHTLFEACRADPACEHEHPALDRVFDSLVARLNTTPAQVREGSPGSGRDVRLNGSRFAFLIWQALYYSEAIPHLPAIVHDAADGDFTRLARLIDRTRVPDTRSEGMQQSIECAEMAPFMTPSGFSARARELSPGVRQAAIDEFGDVFGRCTIWNVPAADRRAKEPLRTDTPVLLLAGAFDPATPPASARATAATLTNHYLFVFPDSGHGVFRTNACARAVINAFLPNPERNPGVGCLAELSGPIFVGRKPRRTDQSH
jgi:pimeloyl-ACP methyl ester carboxylesterase